MYPYLNQLKQTYALNSQILESLRIIEFYLLQNGREFNFSSVTKYEMQHDYYIDACIDGENDASFDWDSPLKYKYNKLKVEYNHNLFGVLKAFRNLGKQGVLDKNDDLVTFSQVGECSVQMSSASMDFIGRDVLDIEQELIDAYSAAALQLISLLYRRRINETNLFPSAFLKSLNFLTDDVRTVYIDARKTGTHHIQNNNELFKTISSCILMLESTVRCRESGEPFNLSEWINYIDIKMSNYPNVQKNPESVSLLCDFKHILNDMCALVEKSEPFSGEQIQQLHRKFCDWIGTRGIFFNFLFLNENRLLIKNKILDKSTLIQNLPFIAQQAQLLLGDEPLLVPQALLKNLDPLPKKTKPNVHAEQLALNKALCTAAIKGDSEKLLSHIMEGANLEYKSENVDDLGLTPLCLAVKYGKVDSTCYLVLAGADVNPELNNGKFKNHNLLSLAAHFGRNALIILLFKMRPIDMRRQLSSAPSTLLSIAAAAANTTAELLIDFGAKPQNIPQLFSTATNTELLASYYYNHLELKQDINTRLLNAAKMGHVNELINLLSQDADIEAQSTDLALYRYTPLLVAAHYGQVEVIKLLAGLGANVKACVNGYGILWITACNAHLFPLQSEQIIIFLVKNFPKEMKEQVQDNPLQATVVNNNTKTAKLLIDLGADRSVLVSTDLRAMSTEYFASKNQEMLSRIGDDTFLTLGGHYIAFRQFFSGCIIDENATAINAVTANYHHQLNFIRSLQRNKKLYEKAFEAYEQCMNEIKNLMVAAVAEVHKSEGVDISLSVDTAKSTYTKIPDFNLTYEQSKHFSSEDIWSQELDRVFSTLPATLLAIHLGLVQISGSVLFQSDETVVGIDVSIIFACIFAGEEHEASINLKYSADISLHNSDPAKIWDQKVYIKLDANDLGVFEIVSQLIVEKYFQQQRVHVLNHILLVDSPNNSYHQKFLQKLEQLNSSYNRILVFMMVAGFADDEIESIKCILINAADLTNELHSSSLYFSGNKGVASVIESFMPGYKILLDCVLKKVVQAPDSYFQSTHYDQLVNDIKKLNAIRKFDVLAHTPSNYKPIEIPMELTKAQQKIIREMFQKYKVRFHSIWFAKEFTHSIKDAGKGGLYDELLRSFIIAETLIVCLGKALEQEQHSFKLLTQVKELNEIAQNTHTSLKTLSDVYFRKYSSPTDFAFLGSDKLALDAMEVALKTASLQPVTAISTTGLRAYSIFQNHQRQPASTQQSALVNAAFS